MLGEKRETGEVVNGGEVNRHLGRGVTAPHAGEGFKGTTEILKKNKGGGGNALAAVTSKSLAALPLSIRFAIQEGCTREQVTTKKRTTAAAGDCDTQSLQYLDTPSDFGERRKRLRRNF